MSTPLFGEMPPAEDSKPRKSGTRGEREFVDQVMYWLTAPYLAWPGQESIWEAGGNRNKAVMRRLAEHRVIWDNKQCTERRDEQMPLVHGIPLSCKTRSLGSILARDRPYVRTTTMRRRTWPDGMG